MNIPSCDPALEEDCKKYEYSGDLNRNKMAHGKGRLVWQDGTEIEGEWVNGNLIKGKINLKKNKFSKRNYI